MQTTTYALDFFRRTISEESFDFLDDIDEVFEKDFCATQCLIDLSEWAVEPQIILDLETEIVYGEVFYCLLLAINQSGNIQSVDDKKQKLLSITHIDEPRGLRGMAILLKEITIASETQFTLHENFIQYQNILKIVVEHELRADGKWRGLLPDWANVILGQFAVHRGLSQALTDICSWTAYSTVLQHRTLDFTILLDLIQKIHQALDKLSNEEHLNIFWTATDSFTEAALSIISNLRNNSELNTNSQQLSALLECLKELKLMGPSRTGLFDLGSHIIRAVLKGTFDWYSQVVGEQNKGEDDDQLLIDSIRICQKLITDLETVLSVQEPIFQRIWEISAFSLVYFFYDGQLVEAESIKPLVYRIGRTLKLIKPNKQQIISIAFNEISGEMSNKEISSRKTNVADAFGTSTEIILSELYLSLQKLYRLSSSLPPNKKTKDVKLTSYYTWFKDAVDRWLDITSNRALLFIGKAVSLDNLQTVDSLVKYSSSAVDTVTFFYQLKTYWEELAWPDGKRSVTYVNKIVEDLKRLSFFYAEAMQLKLEETYFRLSSDFFISPNICASINSILHIQQSIKPLAEELYFFELNKEARWIVYDGSPEPIPSHISITDNAVKDINAKLYEIYLSIASRIEVGVFRLAKKVMETNFRSRETDELKSYICNLLLPLGSHLPRDVSFRVVNTIFQHILKSFLKIVESEVQNKGQPVHFRQWEKLLNIVKNCFQNPNAESHEILTKIRMHLKLHGMDTADLIRLYRLERMKQTEGQDVGFGSLAVRIIFINDELNINILNGRNLNMKDISSSFYRKSIGPYVEVQLLPTRHFPEVDIKKSKVHKNTLFPLFEENFTFPVPKSLQTDEECCVLFTVKDKKMLLNDEIMGESFLNFLQVPRSDIAVDLNELNQVILPLSMPVKIDSEYLNVLGGRTWDRTARDFAKREKKLVKQN